MGNPAKQRIVDQLLDSGQLPLSPEQNCPYLPNRRAQHRGFWIESLDPGIYHALMDRGFRRSGKLFYQPSCPSCSECIQTRLCVGQFEPSKSQRRVWRLNSDLDARVAEPTITDAKLHLYGRYLKHQHDDTMSDTWEDLYSFLYDSPVQTIEISYYLRDQLIGVSLADQSPDDLSSVYMYFDPQCARRSLGTFSALWEIDYCRREHIPYYYLGFYVKNCTKMNYKGNFRPQQRLSPDYHWITVPQEKQNTDNLTD